MDTTITAPAETVIKGRAYTVAIVPSGPLLVADMKARGWDGETYLLTGKRGAAYIAFRARQSGAFEIVRSAR